MNVKGNSSTAAGKLINFLPYELNKHLLNSRIHLTLTDAPLYIFICEKFCEKLSVCE